MSWKGREQVGSCTQDNLIAGSRHPLDICQVVIKAGQNLKRGTLLEEDTEAGKYVIRGTNTDAEPDLQTMWTRQRKTPLERHIVPENLRKML